MYTQREQNRVHSSNTDVTETLLLSLQHHNGYVVYPFNIYLANVCIQCSEENINVKDIMRV